MNEIDSIQSCGLPSAEKINEVSVLFKALSDGTRLQILMYLAENQEKRCACDIWEMFPVGQPTVSHHLKVLKSLNLIEGTRRGTWIDYQITEKGVFVYKNILNLVKGKDRQ